MHAQERIDVGGCQAIRFHFSLQPSKLAGSLNPDVYLFRYLTVIYILALLKKSQRSQIPTDTEYSNLAFHCLLTNRQGTQYVTSRAAVYHIICIVEVRSNCKYSLFFLSLPKVEAQPSPPWAPLLTNNGLGGQCHSVDSTRKQNNHYVMKLCIKNLSHLQIHISSTTTEHISEHSSAVTQRTQAQSPSSITINRIYLE